MYPKGKTTKAFSSLFKLDIFKQDVQLFKLNLTFSIEV